MNHAQIVDLATAIQGLRPDWQQPGIVAQLKQLDGTWPGTMAAFYVHAVTVAANPTAETPGALNVFVTVESRDAKHGRPVSSRRSSSEPTCHICTRPRSQCEAQRVIEERRGLETHDFETLEDAKAHTKSPNIHQRSR